MIEILETQRLLLRPFREGDREELFPLHAEESFWWYPLRRAMTDEESEEFLTRVLANSTDPERPAFHAVIERGSGSLIGWVGLSVPDFLPQILPAVEVGWRLGAAWRGRGYATEAAAATLRWGFTDLGLESVVSIFELENVASGRVMDRLGFDTGFETIHPVRGLPLVVRTLTVADWRTGVGGEDSPQ